MRARSTPAVAFVALVLNTSLGSGKALARDSGVASADSETYSPAITIIGPPAKRRLVREQLDALAELPTGARLLAEIEKVATPERRIRIEVHEAKAYAYADDESAAVPRKFTKDGDVVRIDEPGPGTGARIEYDPAFAKTFTALFAAEAERLDDPRMVTWCQCATPRVILGHELLHALHYLQGRALFDVPYVEETGNETNYEERVTSGLGGVAADDGLHENALREEAGVVRRTSYEWMCPNPPDRGGFDRAVQGILARLSRQKSASKAAAPASPVPVPADVRTETPAGGASAARRARVLNRPLGE